MRYISWEVCACEPPNRKHGTCAKATMTESLHCSDEGQREVGLVCTVGAREGSWPEAGNFLNIVGGATEHGT